MSQELSCYFSGTTRRSQATAYSDLVAIHWSAFKFTVCLCVSEGNKREKVVLRKYSLQSIACKSLSHYTLFGPMRF